MIHMVALILIDVELSKLYDSHGGTDPHRRRVVQTVYDSHGGTDPHRRRVVQTVYDSHGGLPSGSAV
jgi:hypothetical protein